jgi:uncharacterized protein DUF6644
MTAVAALNFVQSSALAHAISKSNHLLIASLQVLHVLGFVLLLASLVLISLRLLNCILSTQAVSEVAAQAVRLLWLGLALAVGSGVLMFIGSPKHYFYNSAFELKMALLAAAIIFQASLFRWISTGAPAPPWLTRVSVGLSLALWFAVSMAGRAIGFV